MLYGRDTCALAHIHIFGKCTTKNCNGKILERKVAEHLFFWQKIAYFAPAK